MEAFQRVGKSRNRQVADQILKCSECIPHFIGELGILDRFEGPRAVDITDGSPEVTRRVDIKILTIAGRDYPWHDPVMSLRASATTDMLGEGAHVLHDQIRLLEDLSVDTL